MNVVKLLILGVIRELGPSHGYAIRKTLDQWHVHTWTRLHTGSVYHALRQLSKEGLLKCGAEESGSRGPGKVSFKITDAGEVEFFSQLEEALSSFDLVELSAGIAFLDCLSDAERQSRLADTICRLKENANHLASLASATPAGTALPRARDLLELWRANLLATASSLEGLVSTLPSRRK